MVSTRRRWRKKMSWNWWISVMRSHLTVTRNSSPRRSQKASVKRRSRMSWRIWMTFKGWTLRKNLCGDTATAIVLRIWSVISDRSPRKNMTPLTKNSRRNILRQIRSESPEWKRRWITSCRARKVRSSSM